MRYRWADRVAAAIEESFNFMRPAQICWLPPFSIASNPLSSADNTGKSGTHPPTRIPGPPVCSLWFGHLVLHRVSQTNGG